MLSVCRDYAPFFFHFPRPRQLPESTYVLYKDGYLQYWSLWMHRSFEGQSQDTAVNRMLE
jgi:hypothetical protein